MACVLRGLSLGAVAAVVVLVGVACGGGDQEAQKVGRIVRADVGGNGGSCHRVRTALVSHQQVTLFSCTMRGVPRQQREFGQWNQPIQQYCYAVEGDYGIRASDVFGPTCDKRKK